MTARAPRWPLAIACVACLLPLFASRWLPMVDLAQHAAQLSLWIHRDDPTFFPEGLYRFNVFTPYLGAYLLARAFAVVATVPTAMKLTVAVAVVAMPLAAAWLLRVTRGELAWVLLAAPLAFGVSFFSGFLNFLLAVPVALALIAATLEQVREPSRRGAACVGALAMLLALCHAAAYGIGFVVALAAAWGASEGWRAALRRALPLGIPLPLVAGWAALTWLGESHVRTGMRWSMWPTRAFRLPAALVGSPDALGGVLALAAIVAVLALLGVRLRWSRATGATAAAAAATYLLLPDGAFHTVLLPERFAALLAILLLPALRLPLTTLRRGAAVALLALFATGWSAHLAVRFRAFDREMAGFERVLAAMEPGRIVRVVPVDARSRAVPGYPMFWNVGAWYQAEKGGGLGFSFAQLFPMLVRYREAPPWAEPFWAKRGELEWRPEDRAVDYVVLRTESEDPGVRFSGDPAPPQLILREGAWWLYGRRRIRP